MKGEPVKSLCEIEKISDICKIYKRNGIEQARRWFSTSEDEKIKAAILLLTITECGFSISIDGPAFNVVEDQPFMNNANLSITRTGFGIGGFGPKDEWFVNFNNTTLQNFDNPEKAVAYFMEIRQKIQIGHDMDSINFYGHGCPRHILEEIENE